MGFRGLERQDYASDEGMWIWISQKTWPLFRDGAWDDPAWESMDATWGYVNPPVAKYLLGASLEAQGVSWEWKAGARPPADVLGAARAPSALLGVAGCLVLFWIGLRTLGPASGLLAGLLLAVSPLWAEVARRTMTDVYGAVLGLFAVGAMVPALAELDGRRRVRVLAPWVALSGALSGLAVGAKLNAASVPALLGVLLLATLGLTLRRSPDRRGRDAAVVVALGILFAAGSVAAFVGSNPYLHEDAWNRFSGMLAFWKDMCLERVERAAAGGFGQAFHPSEMGARILCGKYLAPLKAAGLPALVAVAAAATLSRLPRPGARAGRLAGWLLLLAATVWVGRGGNQLIHSWLPWLGLLGAVLAAVTGPRKDGEAAPGPALRLLFPVWLVVVLYFVWRMTYLPQSRYYLPLLPVACLAAGWGLSALRRDVAASGRSVAAWLLDAGIVAGIASVVAASPDHDAALVKRAFSDAPAGVRILHWSALGLVAAAAIVALPPGRRATPPPDPSGS